MSSKLTKSEQLKRKANKPPKKNSSFNESGDDENDDDETCFLLTFEEKEGIKDFGVVKASDVEVLVTNPDMGIYKYRGKSYVVDILKRGIAF
jgi:hypothetical protein